MKNAYKLLSLILTVIMTLSLCTVNVAAATTVETIRLSYHSDKILVNTNKAYCYSWPSSSSSNYGYYSKDQLININGTTNNGWYFIDYQGTTMYLNPKEVVEIPCINITNSKKYSDANASYKKYAAFNKKYDYKLETIADQLYQSIMTNPEDESYPIEADIDSVTAVYDILAEKYFYGVRPNFNLRYYTVNGEIEQPVYVCVNRNDVKALLQKKANNDYYLDQALSSIDFTNVSTVAQKVRVISNFINDAIDYDDYKSTISSTNRNLYYNFAFECLLSNKGVCDDYATMFKYMLNRVGVNCEKITGVASSNGTTNNHAWNSVVNDNGITEYYDLTWNEVIRDKYYAMTYAQISADHFPD